MITVNLDITAPLYWWKDFYTYEVGTVANSCSTMHKITAKEFEWSDFSTEHLLNFGMWGEQFTDADAIYAPAKTMGCVISALNGARDRYLSLAPLRAEITHPIVLAGAYIASASVNCSPHIPKFKRCSVLKSDHSNSFAVILCIVLQEFATVPTS